MALIESGETKNRNCLVVCRSSDLMCEAAEHMSGPCHSSQQCKTTCRASSAESSREGSHSKNHDHMA